MKIDENNTFLWDKFKHTDPKFTKPFPKFGKTLTTIDPMYQVMTMTRVFGPVGKGWNYEDCLKLPSVHAIVQTQH